MMNRKFHISTIILSMLACVLMLLITVATAYYLVNMIDGSMRDKAGAYAVKKGRVDTVTSVRLDPMHYCKYKITPYEVTGVKNGEPATVHVCYSGVNKLNYVD